MMGFSENHVKMFFFSKTEEMQITNSFTHKVIFPRNDRMNNPVKINFFYR